jgi:signal peptide peptidase SppA
MAGPGKVVIDPNSDPEMPETLYVVSPDGVGIACIDGPMMKAKSKFGGCSTIQVRRALRAMTADPDVLAILISIDSPGGTVAGTAELGDEVAAADKLKPVCAHISDCGASAAYWVASRARTISANAAALVGSIGTVGVLEDSSAQAKAEGVVVHVLSTGPHKGVGIDGSEITPEHIASYQGLIDQMGEQFFSTVKKGRGLTDAQMRKATTGEVWMAADAKEMGLIDGVESMDDAVLAAAKMGRAVKRERRAGATAMAMAEISIAEAEA